MSDDIRISRESRFWHHRVYCRGRYCAIHNPSNHYMKNWPQQFEPKLYEMYRICEHGYKHHDPDHVDYMVNFKGRSRASFNYMAPCMCGRPPFPPSVKHIITECCRGAIALNYPSSSSIDNAIMQIIPILEAHYNAKSR